MTAPAQAVPDSGWTEIFNNNYCQSGLSGPCGTEQPDCVSLSSCGGWRDSVGVGRPYIKVVYLSGATSTGWNSAVSLAASQFINSGPPSGIQSATSPVMSTANRSDYVGTLSVDAGAQGNSGFCGSTFVGAVNGTPLNYGSPNQVKNFTNATMSFNTSYSYGTGGPPTYNCNPPVNVAQHELGHAIGLGHTLNGAQVMYSKATSSTPHTGDIAGPKCIYDFANTTGFTCY